MADDPKPNLRVQMPDGTSHELLVPDSFFAGSKEQQDAFVLGYQKQNGNTAPAAPKDTSFSGALAYGTRNAADGLAATGQVAGEQLGGDGLAKSAAAVRKSLGDGGSYDPAGPKVAEGLRQGNYLDAAGYVPRAAVEMAPDVGAALAAFKVGKMPGLIAYMASRTGGQNAETRAAANNHERPTTSDVIGSLPATAVDTALGVVGTAVPGIGKLSSPVAKAGARVAAEGLSNAGQEAVHQTLTTVGTDKGMTVDPAEVGAAGIVGGAARGGVGAVAGASNAVGRGAAAVGRKVAGEGPPIPTVEAAASIDRIADAVPRIQEAVRDTTGRDLTEGEALNSYRKEVEGRLKSLVTTLRDNHHIAADDVNRVLKPLFEQAARHNSDIYSGKEFGGRSAWDMAGELDIPPQAKVAILDGMRDLSNLSEGSRKGRDKGPLEKVGKWAGRTGAIIGGISSGGALGAVSAAGHPILAAGGAHIGAALDRALGLARPSVVRQASKARKMLDAAGRERGGDTMESLDKALEELRKPRSLEAALGIINGLKGPKFSVEDPSAPGGTSLLTAKQVGDAEKFREQGGRDLAQMLIRKDRAEKAARERSMNLQERAADQVSGMAFRRDKGTQESAARELLASQRSSQAAQERGMNLQERAADQVSGMAYRMAGAEREAGFTGMSALTAKRDFGLGTAGAGYDAAGNPVPVPRPGGAVMNGRAAAVMARLQAQRQSGVGDPQPGASPILTGGKAYIQTVLKDMGVQATPGDINAAIDTLVQADRIDPAVGEALKAHKGPLPDAASDPGVQAIIAQVAVNRGKSGVLAGLGDSVDPENYTATSPGPSPIRGPILDPQRWLAVRADVKQHVERLAGVAEQRGAPSVADAIRDIGGVKFASQKEAIRSAFLSSLPPGSPIREVALSMLDDATLMKGI